MPGCIGVDARRPVSTDFLAQIIQRLPERTYGALDIAQLVEAEELRSGSLVVVRLDMQPYRLIALRKARNS